MDDAGRMMPVMVEDPLLQYVGFERVRVLGRDGMQWKMDSQLIINGLMGIGETPVFSSLMGSWSGILAVSKK